MTESAILCFHNSMAFFNHPDSSYSGYVCHSLCVFCHFFSQLYIENFKAEKERNLRTKATPYEIKRVPRQELGIPENAKREEVQKILQTQEELRKEKETPEKL